LAAATDTQVPLGASTSAAATSAGSTRPEARTGNQRVLPDCSELFGDP
jgi:hypothetical protein